jgi:hypothetical protein
LRQAACAQTPQPKPTQTPQKCNYSPTKRSPKAQKRKRNRGFAAKKRGACGKAAKKKMRQRRNIFLLRQF